MPKPVSITGRSSSITNSFVNGIIPVIQPTEAEIDEALHVLNMTVEAVRCAYCGDASTEWDHLHALVRDQKPTGYVSEIANLVPACGKCNQSKGNREWREWMTGPAKLSPKTRRIADLDARMESLDSYERRFAPIRVDFDRIVDSRIWARHWQHHVDILEAMREAQAHAEKVREAIRESIGSSPDSLRLRPGDRAGHAGDPAQ